MQLSVAQIFEPVCAQIAAMAEVIPHPAAEMCACDKCRRSKPKCEGRKHGNKWICKTCFAVLQMIHRKMGSFPQLSSEDTRSFFQRVADKPEDGRLKWECVRAQLKEVEITRAISAHASETEGKKLPLQVWVNQGWSPSKVKNCPSFEDDVLGTLYQVPVETERTSDLHEKVEQSLLERETQVNRKGGKAKPGEADWNVPADCKATGKQEQSDAKKAAKLLAESERHNRSLAKFAAKGLGLLLSKLDSVRAALPKTSPGDTQTALKEAEEQFVQWSKASRDIIAAAESRPQGDLGALPYTKDSLKAALDAASDLVQAVRPPKDPKKRAAPKAAERANPKKRAAPKAAPESVPKKRATGKQRDSQDKK